METINLLPTKSRLHLKQLRLIQKLDLAAAIFLASFLLLALVVFALQFYLGSEIKKNKEKLSQAQGQFSQYLDRLDELENLRFRVKLVAQTLEGRSLMEGKVRVVEEIIGEEGVIKDLKIKGGEIELRGETAGLTGLEGMETRISQGEYKLAELTNLGDASGGGVSFSLKLKQ